MPRIDLLILKSRNGDQRPDADARMLRHHAQPLRDDFTVLPHDGNEIRHCSERNDVKVIFIHALLLPLPKRLTELERDADARKPLLRIGTVRAVRIEHGKRGRQLRPRQMMIGDDDVERPAHRIHRFHGRNPAVHRNEQRTSILPELLQGGQIDAISFRKAIRDVVRDIAAECADIFRQERRRGHAVHIIVSIDYDRRAAVDRIEDARGGNLHIRHEERIVKCRFLRMQKRTGGVRRTDAALP